MNYNLETGPIRPPSEAGSLLLRVTRNCPWNRCAFCPVYKKEKFSPRSVDELKNDIDTVHYFIENLNDSYLRSKIPFYQIQQLDFWHQNGGKNLFLQDADSLVLKTDHLVEILSYAKKKFPSIQRVTSYSRAKTISRKSINELERLKEVGLKRIHIGLESGSDNVLQLISKGVTAREQIEAGKKVVAVGIELSEYFMPGLGGQDYSNENAIQTALVLNEINPTFIRIRSTIPIPETPLEEMRLAKKWQMVSEEGKIKEIRLLIKGLAGISSKIKSDHAMNLLTDLEGELPKDKEKMIQKIDRFFNMNLNDRESFIIGKRFNFFHTLSDYRFNSKIESVKVKLKKDYSSLDEALLELLRNFI